MNFYNMYKTCFFHKRIILLSILFFFSVYITAQMLTVKGKVTDTTGEPVIGATIMIKGQTKGTVTDIDGNYSIGANMGDILVFSHVTSVRREIKVTNAKPLNVILKENEKALDEVIVVAYGVSKKSSFTGSAEMVSSEALKSRPVTEVTKSLDGKVSGVMTTSGSGQPGAGAQMTIRGFGSINASSNPLIVVDGMPYDGDLNSINANDIENISILKDASAGALYGARGANGVLLITTKTAKDAQKVNVEFNSKFSVISRAIPNYSTVNTKQYMELMYNAVYNDLTTVEGYLPQDATAAVPEQLASELFGTNNIYNPYACDVQSIFDASGHVNNGLRPITDEDWIKQVTANAPLRQEYQLSLSGNNKVAKYLFSLSYLDEDGLLKTTDFSRYTARANIDLNINKYLDTGLNLNYSHTESSFLGASGSNNTNVWFSAQLMAPIYPVYQKNADGTFVVDANGAKQFDYGSSRPAGAQNNRNSLATLYDDSYGDYSDIVSAKTYLKAHYKDFSFTSNLGLDVTNTNQATKYNLYNGNAAGTGRLTKEYERLYSYTWNQLLGYSKELGEHQIDALLGHEFYGYRSSYINAERTGFPFGDFQDLALGSNITQGYTASDKYYIDSFLSRLNYNYKDRYYLSGSFRTDASSRFEKKHRWGNFWSLGASWRISEEPFMKFNWLNNMTIKASYGVQGNDNIGTYYAWQALYNMNYANSNYSGGIISSLENKNISWENNGNLNLGVEFKLFDRLTGTIEYFNRKTTDLLLQKTKAPSQGIGGYYANVGSLTNSGMDISLGYDLIKNADFGWNISYIGSLLKNKINELADKESSIISGYYIDKPGYAVNSFYMSKSAGIDPVTGKQLYWAYELDDNGQRIEGSDYITSDQNKAANCKYICGSRIPKIYGSFSSQFRWKELTFDLLFTYSLGGKIYDSIYRSMMEPSFVGQVYHTNVLRSWKQTGDITDVPIVTTSSTTTTNDRFLVDASYLGIKNVSLAYDLTKYVKKLHVGSLRVFLSMDNLHTFTHLKGMNPQENFSGSTSYSYVPTRSLTLGVGIKL